MPAIFPRSPALFLLLLVPVGLDAQSSPRKDANGDPLPPGAIARLGSMRLRQPDAITALAITPDGKMLFSAGPDRKIRVWDVQESKLLRFLEGHTEEVRGLAVTPDGKSLISTGLDRSLRLWSLK